MLWRRRKESDFRTEIEAHIAQEYERLREQGMSEEEARAAARRAFGNVMRAEERFYETRRWMWWDHLKQDVRFGLRMLAKSPGFTAVAVLTLALGIGANTAIFELLDVVLLRTLPVPAPQELSDIRLNHEGRIGNSVARQKEYSSAQWEQLEHAQQAFSGIAAWSTERFDLRNGGEARYANGLWVSGDFFDVLQVNPALGRLFSKADDYRGCGAQGVVLSYGFWAREFGGQADVIGKALTLDGQAFSIVGVTPPSFYGLEPGLNFDVALPLCSEPVIHGKEGYTGEATTWWLDAIGRLKPGWTIERASAQLAAVAPRIFAATLPPGYYTTEREKYLRFSFRVLPAATGDSPLRTEYKAPLFVLLAISGLILLIACANLASLLLARANAREKEMATRLALGASRVRLARQLMAESLLLAAIGATLGIGLAQMLGRLLIAFMSDQENPISLALTANLRVLLFTVGLAALTCILFGAAPALQATRSDLGTVMKGIGRGITAGQRNFVLRRVLIVTQVALSLVLLVAAMLFVRTFQNLLSLNPGLRQDVLVADFDFSRTLLPAERRLEFKRELWAQVRNTSGVESSAETTIVPLRGDGWNQFIDFPEMGVERKLVDFDGVSPGYFRTLGIPLLAGRDFNENDTTNSPLVAIVNQKFARTFFSDGNVLGQTFTEKRMSGSDKPVFQIVGVVGDTKYRDLRSGFDPIVYVAELQDRGPDPESTLLVRANGSVAPVIAALKGTAERMNPEMVLNFNVLRTAVLQSVKRERLIATLSGFYGLLAAVLATVGIYGVVSYMTMRRRNEIGIRMAMGASKNSVIRMVLRQGLGLVAIGLVVGTVLAVTGGGATRALLFGVKPTDPMTLALAIAGLALVAVGASLVPAMRATGVQPMQVLREE